MGFHGMELLYAWARRALNSQKRRFPARAAARLRDLGGHLRALDARDGGADDENLRREGAQARWDAELQAKAEATNTVVWVVESLADEKPPTLGELRGLQVAFVAQRALDHADELLADAQHAGSMSVVVHKVRKTGPTQVGPEVGTTSAFYRCFPTGMHGPTCRHLLGQPKTLFAPALPEHHDVVQASGRLRRGPFVIVLPGSRF